jgi:hypothetical protein
MNDKIVNKVAESSLMELDLAHYYPEEEVAVFNMKDYLYMGLILKEKDFREALKNKDWSEYANKLVAVTCTVDAIIPVWAYMLVASYLQPIAKETLMENKEEIRKAIFFRNLQEINIELYKDKRVVIKGCGDQPIEAFAYFEITKLLRPVVKSIMYGEPCSTVPIFKQASSHTR